MIKFIVILCISFIDGSYTIDTHNYSFIRECFHNFSIHTIENRENLIKNLLDTIDLFL